MPTKMRLILAYLFAPLVPALYNILWLEIINRQNANAGHQRIFIVIFYSLVLSYLSCLLLGPLVIRILDKKNALIYGQ